MTCIFNGIYLPTYAQGTRRTGSGTTVVYIGSLVQEKGFHILAKVWPRVIARVPSASLKVIGTGQVYNDSAELGRWGVADEEYERKFRPYLADKEGNPDKSVEFLGRVGAKEKISILQQADIGIVNPNWDPKIGTETCSMTTIEFQACGIPVISAAEDGSLDTIVPRCTGLLNHNEHSLMVYIVRLLENKKLREQYGCNATEYIQSKFDYEKICSQWRDLFWDVINNRPNTLYPLKSNIFYHYKFLRELMRLVKDYVPSLRIIPSISTISATHKRKFLLQHFSRIIPFRRCKDCPK